MISGLLDRHPIASPMTLNYSSHQFIPCPSSSAGSMPANFFFDKSLDCEPSCLYCWNPDTSTANAESFHDPMPPSPPFYENLADLLPSDPFGMGVSAAIAELIEYLASTVSYLEFGNRRSHDAATGDCSTSNSLPDAAVGGAPHDGLLFVLHYLKVRDLLSMERVCKTLNYSIREDPLLWRCIHIGQPLSFRIRDDGLLRLTRKAQGNLECLFLRECRYITNDCLGLVLMENLKLKQLSIPGCLNMTVAGLLDNLTKHKLKGGALMQLSFGRVYDVKHDQYQELRALLDLDDSPLPAAPKKPRFYHLRNSLNCWARGGGRYLDVESCPRCGSIRVIYDCTLDHSGKVGGSSGDRGNCRHGGLIGPCRACAACISRCDECGRCIHDLDYEETFMLERVCFPCMNYPTESQLLEFQSQPPTDRVTVEE